MQSNHERYQTKRTEVTNSYDTALVGELLTMFAGYAQYWEDRYCGAALFNLLRLIRVNPQHLFDNEIEFYNYRVPSWVPSHEAGAKIKLSKRHPLYKFLHSHFPSEHRVWRYINHGTATPEA